MSSRDSTPETHQNDSFSFLMSQSFWIFLTPADHSSLTNDLHYSEISICGMKKDGSPPPAASHPVDRVKSDIWFPFTPDKNLFGKRTNAVVKLGLQFIAQ